LAKQKQGEDTNKAADVEKAINSEDETDEDNDDDYVDDLPSAIA